MAGVRQLDVDAERATEDGQLRLRGGALAGVLSVLLLAVLLAALGQTAPSAALPDIVASLHGFDRYTWPLTAYLSTMTIMLPVAGKLSGRFGRKRSVLAGMALFLVGSALAGAAQTMDQLIAFRTLQGLGAGAVFALALRGMGDIFTPGGRAKWLLILVGGFGGATAEGPEVGEWLTAHGPLLARLVTDATRWRWIFYANLPLGIPALVALALFMPADLGARRKRPPE